MTQKRHTMHGRDHACGGADPIPGICDIPSGGNGMNIVTGPTDGFWKLNETAGTTAHDSSGNGYHMEPPTTPNTCSPPTWAADTTPYGEHAPSFTNDGPVSLSYREGEANFSLPTLNADLTVMIWARKLVDAGYNMIGQGMLTLGSSVPSNTGVSLYWGSDSSEAGRITLNVGLSAGYPAAGWPIYDPGWYASSGWHMIAATRAGTIWTLYVDGTAQAGADDGGHYLPDAGFGVTSRSWIGVGGSYPGANLLSYGALLHHALTAAEIADLYASGMSGATTKVEGKTIVVNSDDASTSWQYPLEVQF